MAQEQPRLRIMGRNFQFNDEGIGWMGTWVDPSDKHRCVFFGGGEEGGACLGVPTPPQEQCCVVLLSWAVLYGHGGTHVLQIQQALTTNGAGLCRGRVHGSSLPAALLTCVHCAAPAAPVLVPPGP